MTDAATAAAAGGAETAKSNVDGAPDLHAYHRNLPPYCIDPSDGRSYLSKYAEGKAGELIRLVNSIDLSAIDWNAWRKEESDGGGDGAEGRSSGRGEERDVSYAESDDEDILEEECFAGFGDAEDDDDAPSPHMATIVKKCARLNVQLSTVLTLKHYTLSQRDLCRILLKVLTLLCATLETTTAGDGSGDVSVVLRVDEVGFLLERVSLRNVDDMGEEAGTTTTMAKDVRNSISDVRVKECKTTTADGAKAVDPDFASSEFALPTPARDSLLSAAITLLSKSKKALILQASHLALPPYELEEEASGEEEMSSSSSTGQQTPLTLVLHWRVLLAMLLRTAPEFALDYASGTDVGSIGTLPPTSSHSRLSSALRKTVSVIRASRHFFDQQGLALARPLLEGGVSAVDASELPLADTAAREIWSIVRSDLLFRTHTNACFRGLIVLYLFLPSRCSETFYSEVLPEWQKSWSSIDRCNDFDCLWLHLFCRARKYASRQGCFDWGPVRKKVLSNCGYWLQIPMGGASDDRAFPRAAPLRSRGVPSILKKIVGSSSVYQEGLDFVEKLANLLVFCIGRDEESDCVTVVADGTSAEVSSAPISQGTADILRFLAFVAPYFNPSNTGPWTFPLGTVLHYLSYEFSHRIATEWGQAVLEKSHPTVASSTIRQDPYFDDPVPHNEIVAVLDSLLPLCQQAVYSKNSYVGRAGESALLSLAQIAPQIVSPPFLDFAARALDVSSINMSHQAPSALSLLQHLVQPSVRRRPSILLERLPDILNLSLAGIDSNDQRKTVSTLSLYHSIVAWLPVGGVRSRPKRSIAEISVSDTTFTCSDKGDGTIRLGNNLIDSLSTLENSTVFAAALSKVPESSLIYRPVFAVDEYSPSIDSAIQDDERIEDACLSMSEWSLSFLDRVYGLLRAAAKTEKVAKAGVGVASRHSSVDAQQTRMFSRYLRSCLRQIFASMDKETHERALRSVCDFVSSETLPFAAKDAASLCEAAAMSTTGLDALVPLLTSGLETESSKTVMYRLRCLSGAVRHAGPAVLSHGSSIISVLEFALSERGDAHDKHVFKIGCKLLRHTLASQVEAYPLLEDGSPRINDPLGKSAHLHGDNVKWNSPTGEQIDFAVELLERFALERIRELVADGAGTDTDSGADFINLKLSEMDVDMDNGDSDISDAKERGIGAQSVTAASATSSGAESTSKKIAIKRDEVRKRLIQKWRRSLKTLKYSLRGIVGILLDEDDPDTNKLEDLHPHELSVSSLLSTASSDTRKRLFGLRGKLCVLLSSMMSMIAHETCDAESKVRPDILDKSSYASAISSDTKICVEITEAALLLLTRRGAFGHVAQDKGAFQSLKEMSKNQVLSCQASHIWCALQRAQVYGEKEAFLYKDGEDGGKCLPRRLLITRVWLFHREVQHSASFDIPRRLRKRWMGCHVSTEGNNAAMAKSKGYFSAKLTYSQFQGEIELYLDRENAAETVDSLKAYEGVVDGLIALTCHTNVEVRGCALGVLDSSLSRFGWFIRDRVPRLLRAIDLADDELRGEFGVPSCSQLSKQVDSDSNRKRLAEVIKGVCAIVANSRTMKHILATESSRYQLIKTLSSTQQLLSVLPTEEHLKVLHFLQVIFSRFRSRWHSLPRYRAIECQEHLDCLLFLLEKLVASEKLNQVGSEGKNQQKEGTDSDVEPEISALSSASSESGSNDITMMHWRNQLLVCWFLTHLVESSDLMDEAVAERIGRTCLYLLQNEMGQPLQRAALGLLGRLITFVDINKAKQLQQGSDYRGLVGFKEKLCDEDFCRTFALALVFNHKADTQVGGGHRAQWSAGVEDVLKDASVNCAPRQLFPFQRGSMHCSTFKVQHARMLQSIMLQIDADSALISASNFLKLAEVLAVAPPNEDQRNKQCTAWELYAGVSRALLLHSSNDEYRNKVWKMVLPFLDKVIPSTPIDMTRAAHDSIRYSIHSMRAGDFYVLTDWIIGRIEKSLWQHSSDAATKDGIAAADSKGGECIPSEAVDNLETSMNGSEGSKEALDSSSSQSGLDGFASQSKWLYLICAVLGEMDCSASHSSPWFAYDVGVGESQSMDNMEEPMLEFKQSFYEMICKRLLPMLLRATGHPYDKCRDHIASCLFRICACHSRFLNSLDVLPDVVRQRFTIDAVSCEPGKEIIPILSTRGVEEHAFKEKLHALITTRKFLAHFVHLGDGKQDFSTYVVPLLPLAFSALKVSEEGDADISSSDRALEAEVAKSFRYSLAEISSSCLISYIDGSEDIVRVLDSVDEVSTSATWQIRQAAAHFLRCFQGCHKFLFSKEQTEKSTNIVARLLADDRREVSSAAIAALTGILAVTDSESVECLVAAQVETAKATIKKRKKKGKAAVVTNGVVTEKEILRSRQQQSSVFFLCAAVLARPYDTPPFVPVALAALSMHSFEHRAPLAVRETVKKCFAEFKRTHMNDNWEMHRKQFTQEQLEALDDVVSTPHYYA